MKAAARVEPGVAYLIVNADDFGLTRGMNEAIVLAHERGIVSSATLMVHGDAAAEAAAYARSNNSLGVGLHVDLWESALRGSDWVRLYARCDDTPEAVRAEVERQLACFRELVGRDPDHLDSHQHVHRRAPANAVLRAVAAEAGLPLRGEGGFGYVGGFYGQDAHGDPYPEGTTPERLVELIDAMPKGRVTELSCHPGFVADNEPLGGTMYRTGRNAERETLVDPRARARLARGDVRLGTFAAFAALATATIAGAGA